MELHQDKKTHKWALATHKCAVFGLSSGECVVSVSEKWD